MQEHCWNVVGTLGLVVSTYMLQFGMYIHFFPSFFLSVNTK